MLSSRLGATERERDAVRALLVRANMAKYKSFNATAMLISSLFFQQAAERQRSQELEGITEAARARLATKDIYTSVDIDSNDVENCPSNLHTTIFDQETSVSLPVSDENT